MQRATVCCTVLQSAAENVAECCRVLQSVYCSEAVSCGDHGSGLSAHDELNTAGKDCYRVNAVHKSQFSHPPPAAAKEPAPHTAKEDCIVIDDDSDSEITSEHTKRRKMEAAASVSIASSACNAHQRDAMNAELRALHFARKARAPEVPSDAREDTASLALARRLQDEEIAAIAGLAGGGSAGRGRGGGGQRSEAAHGKRQAPPNMFKADGLGFWLLKTNRIKEEANSPEFVVRLHDVIVGDIKWAILCNYDWDLNFLFDEVPKLLSIPCVCVLYDRRHEPSRQFNNLPANFRAFVPPFDANDKFGTMHSKFMLLCYDTGIRMVVMTCNFGCTYQMTDALWAQDFPWKSSSSSSSSSPPHSSDFEETLCRYLAISYSKFKTDGVSAGGQCINLKTIHKIDFSGARAVLIASVPGRHKQSEGNLFRWVL